LQAEAVTARTPVATVRQPRLPWLRQFWLLLQIQFSDYKDSAIFLALFSMVMPLGLMWLLGRYVAGEGPAAVWFLAGNAVMTVGFGSANFAIGRIGQLRINKEMDFFAALPVGKVAFMATIFTLSQIAALPGILVSLVMGHWLLHIAWSSILLGVPLALLTAVCLTVVGTAVGSLVRTWGQLNLYSNLIYFVVMFLSPVLVPLDRMVLPLRMTSYALPSGQATLALAEAFAGNFGARFWLFTALVIAWMLAALLVAMRKLDWRAD
jgi:ABC-2 type transport system permease protein